MSTSLQTFNSNSKPEHGINKNVPPTWQSYIRLTRIQQFPAGIILVFWPCAWGLIMSASSVRLPLGSWLLQAAGYLLGCTLLHNASCIWGDMCDVEFDKQGERTKVRPIACGLVSMTGAGILFFIHCLLCVLLLSFAGNAASILRGPALPALETLDRLASDMARRGYDMGPAGVCWTIYYDTIYACQDRRDDVKSGVRSTAVLFGDNVRAMLAVVAAVFVLCLAYAGVLNGNGPMYFLITVVGTAAHLVWQLVTADFDCDADCWRMFARNSDIGYITVAGMLCDYCLRMNV